VVWMASKPLAKLYRHNFPKSLKGAPVLLPTNDTAIRRRLDQSFAAVEVEPRVMAEFEDFALMRVFGREGTGVFPVPTALENQYYRQDKVVRLGTARNIYAHFYAISAEPKIKHPGVMAICEFARREIFA
jgi:LysR family transcriptional regulator, transcriptional activator of nhaA